MKLKDESPIRKNEGKTSSSKGETIDVNDIHDCSKPLLASKLAKLDFPKFLVIIQLSGWRGLKFFLYQGTPSIQKVSLAPFHLYGEANQWWQWLQKTYKEEQQDVNWAIFVDELWARFGPTGCENFDEALSKIKQTGSLREYQK